MQNTRPNAYALRQGEWLFIDSPQGEHSKRPDWFRESWGDPQRASTPAMLFNLADDPAQRENLFAEYPERAAEMRALLERYLGGQGSAPHAAAGE